MSFLWQKHINKIQVIHLLNLEKGTSINYFENQGGECPSSRLILFLLRTALKNSGEPPKEVDLFLRRFTNCTQQLVLRGVASGLSIIQIH